MKDYWGSRPWLYRIPYRQTWRFAGRFKTDISEKLLPSVFMVHMISELGTLAVTSNWSTPVTAIVVPSSLIPFTLMMEAIRPSDLSVLTRATRRNIPGGGILHSHRRENHKSYIIISFYTFICFEMGSPLRQYAGHDYPFTTWCLDAAWLSRKRIPINSPKKLPWTETYVLTVSLTSVLRSCPS
jgi:hypothetical protein